MVAMKLILNSWVVMLETYSKYIVFIYIYNLLVYITDIYRSNYFWGKTVEYTVNGGLHHVAGEDIDKAYHKYTIDWQPDKITWYVDDNVVRVKTKAETCDSSGSCKFPSQPA